MHRQRVGHHHLVNAEVKVRIEIEATFPNGAQDQTKRAVSENAKTLGFGTAEWE